MPLLDETNLLVDRLHLFSSKFILKFFHVHGCGRSYRDHRVLAVTEGTLHPYFLQCRLND